MISTNACTGMLWDLLKSIISSGSTILHKDRIFGHISKNYKSQNSFRINKRCCFKNMSLGKSCYAITIIIPSTMLQGLKHQSYVYYYYFAS